MKTAITGSWVYITVLIFMVILIAFVTITINYSRAFEYSSTLVKSIESHDGLNKSSMKEVDTYLNQTHHNVKGVCSGDYAGVLGTDVDKNPSGKKYDYCVKRSSVTGDDGITKCYYDTIVFFSFSLPVLGDLFTFRVPSETSGMRYLKDDAWGACEP